jgi:hypothetical protein
MCSSSMKSARRAIARARRRVGDTVGLRRCRRLCSILPTASSGVDGGSGVEWRVPNASDPQGHRGMRDEAHNKMTNTLDTFFIISLIIFTVL